MPPPDHLKPKPSPFVPPDPMLLPPPAHMNGGDSDN
jgi:hypothetical protein